MEWGIYDGDGPGKIGGFSGFHPLFVIMKETIRFIGSADMAQRDAEYLVLGTRKQYTR